jgi:hypothetical protein
MHRKLAALIVPCQAPRLAAHAIRYVVHGPCVWSGSSLGIWIACGTETQKDKRNAGNKVSAPYGNGVGEQHRTAGSIPSVPDLARHE